MKASAADTAELIRRAEANGGTVSPLPSIASARGRQHVPGRMNKLEERYAARLEGEKKAGKVLGYWYDAVKLRLADKTWFSPDFLVMLPDGVLEFHETKGFMRDDAAVKLKVAASQYPIFAFVLVKRQKGVWSLKSVPAN